MVKNQLKKSELKEMDIFRLLINGLCEIYGDGLERVILYGSVARGTQDKESDIDIAIFIKKEQTPDMKDKLLDLVVDLELKYDEVLSVLPIDCDMFREWENAMPFYKNMKRDGVILWEAA